MDEEHQAVLSLGSNLEPQIYLPKAVQMLRENSRVAAVSSVWESRSVGFDGPNFLNACLIYITSLSSYDLKEQLIRRIEAQLGRVRTAEKSAPRTVDLDIVLFDGKPLNVEFWNYAFVIVPFAELMPDFIHPVSGEKMSRVAATVRGPTWIVKRDDVRL